jgi:single-strand DNA-binding protein
MFNRVTLIGNLTRNPELKVTDSGTTIGKLSVANNRIIGKDNDGNLKEEVSFIDVTVFGKGAELARQFLTKGRKVLIDGRLKQERWQGDDGTNHSRCVVIAESIEYLDSPKQQTGEKTQAIANDESETIETYETQEEGVQQ